MDGMKDSSKIIIIGATNHIDGMEDASISRFVVINLGLPTSTERKAFIEKFILPIPMEKDINIDVMVKYTEGFTGRNFRDIGMKLNRIRAINKKPVSIIDLLKEITKFMSSSQRNNNRVEDTTKDNSLNCMLSSIIRNEDNTTITYNREHNALYTVDNTVTELTKQLFAFQEVWGKGQINTSNIIEFCMRFVEEKKPQWKMNGESGYYTPSAIKGIAAKVFKLTPRA